MSAISDLSLYFAGIPIRTIQQATPKTIGALQKQINRNYDLATRAARQGTTKLTKWSLRDAKKQKAALVHRSSELDALKKNKVLL